VAPSQAQEEGRKGGWSATRGCRTGLGARLLEALLAEAERRGQRRVLLEVRSDNGPAQRLYERYGFTRSAVRRGYYPGGVDAWVMERTGPA
jgi:[ribosomal protein S18]-alanine N-acetyltransferase